MNKNILNSEIQNFIKENLHTNTLSILLSNPSFKGATTQEVVLQIKAAKKCKKKLPLWYHTPGIYFPLPLQIEQTSSEITAQYKASLVGGENLADLSGGTGVDSFYFASKFKSVHHLEIDQELAAIAAHNFKVLGAKNISTTCQDGVAFIKKCPTTFDWLYIDPSRRDNTKGKVFLLEDCSPNIINMLPYLWAKTNKILIKTAPMLDIKAGLRVLPHVKEIQAVSVNNEVKELLWILEKNHQGPTLVSAALLSLKKTPLLFTSSLEAEAAKKPPLSPVLKYLYEPNVALLKIGVFNQLAQQKKVFKLHPNSHLYTANNLVCFPGRCFKVVSVWPYNKKSLKPFQKTKANVSTRNFKISVANLRKKHHLLDGGDVYLFFTTNLENKPIVVVCQKKLIK